MIQPPSSCHSIWLGFNWVSQFLTWRIGGGKSSYLSNIYLTADWVESTNYIGGKWSSNCCFMFFWDWQTESVFSTKLYKLYRILCYWHWGFHAIDIITETLLTISLFKFPYYVQINLSFSLGGQSGEAHFCFASWLLYRKARAHWLSRRLIAIRFDWCQTYRHPMHPQCWTRFEAGKGS